MANSYSTPDILRGALAKCGEPTNGNSPYHAAVLRNVQRTYDAILSGSNEFDVDLGQPWAWARETNPRVIVLRPALETGTVSMTTDLDTGVFSVAPALSQAGRWLKVTDRPTFYRILSHVAGATSFTIDSEYLEATGATLSFKTLPVQYNVGENVLRLVEPFRVYDQDFVSDQTEKGMIFGCEVGQFRRSFPLQSVREGVPTRFSVVRSSESQCLVEFNAYLPSTKDPVKIECDLIAIQPGLLDAEDSVPLIPRQHRVVLEYGAAFLTWANEKKNSEEAGKYLGLTKAAMKKLIEAEQRQQDHVGQNVGSITPRPDMLARSTPSGYYE